VSELRLLRSEDAERVAALFAEAFGPARLVDAEEIRSWIANEELEPEHLRVLEAQGAIVGYGDIWIEGEEVALDMAAPGHWEPFLDWAETAARERGFTTRASFPAGHELEQVVSRRGYRLARSSYTMEVELREAPLEPGLPDGLTLRAYRGADDREILRLALNEAFENDWHFHAVSPSNFTEFYVKQRGHDPALWLLAWDGDELAGFALASPERPGDSELGWIGTLGVRPAWRRRGLGEALLRAAFARLYARGLRRVGLGVDTENETGALRLYERVGMRPRLRNDNWVLDP
jgi:mycothiol synthase